MKLSIFAPLSALACLVAGSEFPAGRPGILLPPLEDTDVSAFRLANEAVQTTGEGYYVQQLDHKDPSKGTFNQHYWWNSQYWGGPGSPVRFSHFHCALILTD